MVKEQDWRQEANERYKEKSQKGRFKLIEGENTLRLIPRINGPVIDGKKVTTPFYEYMVHRDVGPNKRFVRCGKNMRREGKCWLCDVKILELQGGDSAKQKRAAALEPREQFCLQVGVVDTDTQKMRGPYLWTVPTGGARSLAARLLGVLKTTRREFVDPDEALNITIERTGTGKMDTIYGQITPDETPTKLPDRILTAAKSFESMVAPYSSEQQKAAYFGRDEDETAVEEEAPAEEAEDERPSGKKRAAVEEEEEDVAPPRKKHVEEEEEDAPPPRKKAAVVEDEDAPPPKKKVVVEEEEDAPPRKKAVVEEDEDEPAPKPKKKAVVEEEEDAPPPKKKRVVEEEESEPEAEPEEEEERPKTTKKKVYAEEEEERPRSKKRATVEED
jgi:hypothetical protein